MTPFRIAATVRRLGLWLRRLARQGGVAGYHLLRVKRVNSGQLWAVVIRGV